MNHYTIALFDLDGTLSESGEGILYCVKKIFAETGRTLPDEKKLGTFIGPPMYDSLRSCGFSHEEAEDGVTIYKRHYVEKGIFMQRLYDGMLPLLKELKNSGVRLSVATTKYMPFAERIAQMLGLAPYFDFVAGATAGPERRTKAKVIRYALNHLGTDSSDRIVMIGDTKFDAEGAAKENVDFIGCLYGYGTKEEMQVYQPSAKFVSHPLELLPLITSE